MRSDEEGRGVPGVGTGGAFSIWQPALYTNCGSISRVQVLARHKLDAPTDGGGGDGCSGGGGGDGGGSGGDGGGGGSGGVKRPFNADAGGGPSADSGAPRSATQQPKRRAPDPSLASFDFGAMFEMLGEGNLSFRAKITRDIQRAGLGAKQARRHEKTPPL